MSNFTIINYVSERDVSSIISKLPEGSNVLVVCRPGNEKAADYSKLENVTVKEFPNEDITRGNARNIAIKFGKDLFKTSFMHVLEDSVFIEDVSSFIPAIEKMMTAMNLGSWYNTTCDGVNYVYAKYNPRVSISLDDAELKDVGIRKLLYCSNANFAWSIFNLDIAKDHEMLVDSYYNVPMFMIIETLAARRNNKQKNEMHYMNYYPTIEEELHAFKRNPAIKEPSLRDQIEKENPHFREKHINNSADTNVDVLMEDLYLKLHKD